MTSWLRQAFPNARFVHLVRDPCSVVRSQLSTASDERARSAALMHDLRLRPFVDVLSTLLTMQQRLSDLFKTARDRWAQFRDSQWGARLLTGLRWLFVGGILAYLAYQLTDIGWAQVWASLPTTPWFYILLFLMYATLPATEMVLYGTIWNANAWALLPALLRKRVLNNDVLGYSGEAYFSVWAQHNTNLGYGPILQTIKDNTIISSVASTSVAFLLLALFFLTGQIELLTQYLPSETSTLAASLAVVLLVVIVGINFRRALFSLPSSLLLLIGAGHLTRFILNNGFQVTQWIVVIPEVSVGSWITLLALHIVINQVPFVPSRGLVFMSAGVGLSGPLQIPEAALASMLLAQALIDQGLNFLVYGSTSAFDAVGADAPEGLDDLSLPDET